MSHEVPPSMSARIDPVLADSRILTIKEVAAHLRVCRRTIEREIASGRFSHPLKIGRSIRFSEADVRAYLAKLKEENLGAAPL